MKSSRSGLDAGYQPYRFAMASSTSATRSVRMTSRNPPGRGVTESSGSQIVGVGDARDRATGTTPQVPPASAAGQLVHAERSDAIPLGLGEGDLDIDKEAWESALVGAAGVDAIGKFARFASRVAMPIQDGAPSIPRC